jgi:hypothetical protein
MHIYIFHISSRLKFLGHYTILLVLLFTFDSPLRREGPGSNVRLRTQCGVAVWSKITCCSSRACLLNPGDLHIPTRFCVSLIRKEIAKWIFYINQYFMFVRWWLSKCFAALHVKIKCKAFAFFFKLSIRNNVLIAWKHVDFCRYFRASNPVQ